MVKSLDCFEKNLMELRENIFRYITYASKFYTKNSHIYFLNSFLLDILSKYNSNGFKPAALFIIFLLDFSFLQDPLTGVYIFQKYPPPGGEGKRIFKIGHQKTTFTYKSFIFLKSGNYYRQKICIPRKHIFF